MNGNYCIIMNEFLKYEQPTAFSEIISFANKNRLMVNIYNNKEYVPI